MEHLMRQLRRKAEALYHPLPYHNWGHALAVWANAQRLMERCDAFGIVYNPYLVECMCVLHDINSGLTTEHIIINPNGRPRQAKFREEYQACWGGKILTDLGFPEAYCTATARGILATNPDIRPRTIEESILCAADVMDTGSGSYREFLATGETLAREASMLSGNQPEPKAWARSSMSYLGRYMVRRIRISPEYLTPEGQSSWHLGTFHNVLKLCQARGLANRVVVDIGSNGIPAGSTGDEAPMTGDITHITVARKWKARRHAMTQLTAHAHTHGANPPVLLALPDEDTRLSLPNHTVDIVYMAVAEALRLDRVGMLPVDEITRVLKPGGLVTLYESHPARPSTPFVETYSFVRLDRWFQAHGKRPREARQTSYGYEATYA